MYAHCRDRNICGGLWSRKKINNFACRWRERLVLSWVLKNEETVKCEVQGTSERARRSGKRKDRGQAQNCKYTGDVQREVRISTWRMIVQAGVWHPCRSFMFYLPTHLPTYPSMPVYLSISSIYHLYIQSVHPTIHPSNHPSVLCMYVFTYPSYLSSLSLLDMIPESLSRFLCFF